MIERRGRAGLAIALAGGLLTPLAGAAEPVPYSEMIAVVHLHTSLVDGASSPGRMARLASAAGIDALVITDHFVQRISYGPVSLRPLLQFSWSRPSILSSGAGAYLAALEAARTEAPGIVIVPGVEVTPYARWHETPFSREFRLEGWHRHLLVIGIDDPSVLTALPVTGNPAGGDYTARSLLALLPLAVVAASARFLIPRARLARRASSWSPLKGARPMAVGLAGGVALFLLFIAFPFRVERYPAAGDEAGLAPYRDLIAWVREQGGVSIWAHPEAEADKEGFPGIGMFTTSYAGLIESAPADGFGALPEGVKTLLPAGGVWDRSLEEGLRGPRPGAPFALAESDEHGVARDIDFGALQTVFLVRDRSRDGMMEALRSGRFYGRWTPNGEPPLRLAAFRIEADGRSALSGGSLDATGPVAIHLTVAGGDGRAVTARLIRGGEGIWTTRSAPPIEATIEDHPARTTYYRLDVEGAYPYRLVGNPAVVRLRQEGA